MKIVTQTDVIGTRLGEARAVEIICQSGFGGIDYSMFTLNDEGCALMKDGWKEQLEPVREMAQRYSVPFTQSHSPFPSARKDDDEYNRFIIECTKRAFEISQHLGVEVMVVHPITYGNAGTDFDLNYSFYRSLLPYAEATGVKIALENMFCGKFGSHLPAACGTGKDFRQMLDTLNSEMFVACLDIGHCNLVGEKPADFIRTLGGKHLKALHVHDNDGLRDAHIFPFGGTIEWGEVTKALAEINYSGNFTFESDNTFKRQPETLIPTSAKYLHDIGVSMVDMINSYKN